MPGCLSLFARWLPRGRLPHEASSERESRETATPPHDGPPPPPYEASSPMKGFPSRENFPSGIKQFYSPANSTIDIVFVHGVTADRDATWTGQNASEPWPKTLLPSIFPTARTLALGYDAYVGDVQGIVLHQIIVDHGRNLLSSLSSFRKNDGTDEKPIIFVCHGLGGLICKHALFTSSRPLERHSNIFRSTRGIAFLGTPLFLGTPSYEANLSSLAKIVTQTIGLVEQKNKNFGIIDVYRRGFEGVLANNPTDFDTMHEARTAGGLPPIEVVCFYEKLLMEGFGFVVPRDLAALPRCISIGIHRNHMDMTKFATVDDPGFTDVCETLRRWIERADPNASSADCIARQYGDNNLQYNMLGGKGVQNYVGGSHFESKGTQNFL